MRNIFKKHSGVYLRSNSNNWNTDNEFSVLTDGSLVIRNVKITKGINEFKIADASWSHSCNFGLNTDKPVMLYHNYILAADSNENIKMVAHQDYLVDIFIKHTPNGEQMRIHTSRR